MAAMTERELLAVIGEYEKTALGSSTAVGGNVSGSVLPAGQQMTTLEMDRYNSLNAYMARPLGNEVADRSAVVSPDFRDTVEWIMPMLMRTFVASRVCQFDPEGQDDIRAAQQESEVVHHVFMKQNEGFFILYDMLKDALMLRNGYAQVYDEEETLTSIERYKGLDQMQVAWLMQAQDDRTTLKILEQEEHPANVEIVNGQPQQIPPTFDVKVRRTERKPHLRVECAPPEEMLISSEARRGLDDCPFIEHKTQKTRSRLKEMNYDEDKIDAIAKAQPTWANLISIARNEVTDQLADSDVSDKPSQLVDVRTVYVRVDFDGDGLAELRRVVIGGEQILENEEVEEQGFASCSAIRMPHRHVGISLYDLIMDVQVIKTMLLRSGLDNLYLMNNGRTAVDSERVNVSDLLVSRPGGIVRTRGNPAESVMPLIQPTNAMEQAIAGLAYCDEMRAMRTGVGKDTMGIDADALQDVTKGGQLAAMSAASLKVELIARLLGEGVKDLFAKIHRALRRTQDRKLTLEISGKWVSVDPSSWRNRTKITVDVGLGSGTREEKRQNIMMMGQMQDKLSQFGMVGPRQAWATFQDAAHVMGFENPERYAIDPDPNNPEWVQAQQQHQQQPDPHAAAAQASAQAQVQIANVRRQTEQDKAQADQSIEKMRLAAAVQQQQAEDVRQQARANAQDVHSEADRQNQILMTLVRALSPIIAAQLKQDPAINAGQILSDDVKATHLNG